MEFFPQHDAPKNSCCQRERAEFRACCSSRPFLQTTVWQFNNRPDCSGDGKQERMIYKPWYASTILAPAQEDALFAWNNVYAEPVPLV